MGKRKPGRSGDIRIRGLSSERQEQLANCAGYNFMPVNSFLKKEIVRLLDATPDEIKNPKKDD